MSILSPCDKVTIRATSDKPTSRLLQTNRDHDLTVDDHVPLGLDTVMKVGYLFTAPTAVVG